MASDNMAASVELCRWLGLVPSTVGAITIEVTPVEWTVTVKIIRNDAGELVDMLERYDVTLEERLPVRQIDEEVPVV